MNEHFKSYLLYKTLAHKFTPPYGGNTLDALLAGFESKVITDKDGKPFEETVINESLRLQNVCAKISIPLVRRMESRLEILSMSKREFIELAIISALETAEQMMVENGIDLPLYDQEAVSE